MPQPGIPTPAPTTADYAPSSYANPQPSGQSGVQQGGTPQQAEQVMPKTNPNSTQNALQIAEIRDGIVIMNDGSFRPVVMTKSINFDLMSGEEQHTDSTATQ